MKRLIICCDGTWNTPDQKERGVMWPTNVVKLARWVMAQDQNGVVQGRLGSVLDFAINLFPVRPGGNHDAAP